jgi:hypothetical protein
MYLLVSKSGSRWKTYGVYERAFDRLLHDLKATARQPEDSRLVG